MGSVIFDGSEQQARLILGAMAEVARSGDTELTALDRAALGSAAELVFRLAPALDVAGLERVSPARLAEGLGERGREAIVPLLVIATVDGRVTPAAAERLAAYAEALGVEEPAVRDLQALVHGQLDRARADMLRRNRLSITGAWVEDAASFAAWLLPYRDAPDPALTERYEALAALPPGSFGRAFHDFYRANGFLFAGQPGAVAEAFTTPHDAAHLLSGYGTTPQGELLVSTFTAGMHPVEALAGHILPVIVSWHLGIPLAEPAGSATGALDARKFWVAWTRGDATRGDTFDPAWTFWQHVDQPLVDGAGSPTSRPGRRARPTSPALLRCCSGWPGPGLQDKQGGCSAIDFRDHYQWRDGLDRLQRQWRLNGPARLPGMRCPTFRRLALGALHWRFVPQVAQSASLRHAGLGLYSHGS